MSLPDYFRVRSTVTKSFKASGGDAAFTTASRANGAATQSAKIDLGSPRGGIVRVKASRELAATPTAGATLDYYWNPSTNSSPSTDNMGGASGSDGAYTGYSSNHPTNHTPKGAA